MHDENDDDSLLPMRRQEDRLIFKLVVILTTATLVLSSPGAKRRFDGDQVLQLVPTNQEQLRFLLNLSLSASPDDYDFWTEPMAKPNHPVDVHISRAVLPQFLATLRSLKLPFSVSIANVQKLIEEVDAENEKQGNVKVLRSRGRIPRSIVRRFADYDEIVTWLDEQCSANPSVASCHNLGYSFEGKPIRYIHLSSDGFVGKKKKKAIFIEAGMHAREWLSPATALFIIDRFVKAPSGPSGSTVKYLMENVDWYIVPVANPDGYQYSRTTNRMWRKTRSLVRDNGLICYGVDANRNFDFEWSNYGSSASRCSDLFHGASALSEPETKALADFIFKHRKDLLAFFSLHAYSQFWLVPYGHREDDPPEDLDELMRVAQIGTNALKRISAVFHNNDTVDSEWQVGNSLSLLQYAVSGSSMDWAKAVAKIPYSYALELRPVDKLHQNGFIARESDIEKSGIEVLAGLSAALRAMIEKDDGESSAEFVALKQTSNEADKTSIASNLAYAIGSITSWFVSIFRR